MSNCRRAVAALVLTASSACFAQSAPPSREPAQDTRTLVSMPAQAIRLMQIDMLEHMAALDSAIGLLAEGKAEAAADEIESRIGRGAMGKHRMSPYAPGRHMTPEMHQMGFAMHFAASDFAAVARKGNTQETYAALRKVTSTCVACHYSYRTR